MFDKRSIKLPSGNWLEVEVTEKLLVIVRKHFNIPENDQVGDYYIRMFLYGAVKTALDKATGEL